jgi:hypothetical protein
VWGGCVEIPEGSRWRKEDVYIRNNGDGSRTLEGMAGHLIKEGVRGKEQKKKG